MIKTQDFFLKTSIFGALWATKPTNLAVTGPESDEKIPYSKVYACVYFSYHSYVQLRGSYGLMGDANHEW